MVTRSSAPRRRKRPRRPGEAQRAPEALDSLQSSAPAARVHLPTSFQVGSAPSRNLGSPHETTATPTGLHFPDGLEPLSQQNLVFRELFLEVLGGMPLNATTPFPTTTSIMLRAAPGAGTALGPCPVCDTLPVSDALPLCWARGGRSETESLDFAGASVLQSPAWLPREPPPRYRARDLNSLWQGARRGKRISAGRGR